MINNKFIKKEGDFLHPSDFQKIEEELGVLLPSIYKDFLSWSNGVRLYYNQIFRTIEKNNIQSMCVEKFYSLGEAEKMFYNLRDYEIITDDYDSLLPIAESNGKPLICLSLKSNREKIYIIDSDFGITFQAENLTEFISQIKFNDLDLPPPWEYY